jgi:hypothetical protein
MGILLLRFDKQDMFRRGHRVVAQDPIGMSGGSVWLMPDLEGSQLALPRFAGILTWWHKGAQKRILATRAVAVVQLLLELDADLARWMPPLAFGNAT